MVSPVNQSSRLTCVRRTACASAAFAAGAALATAGVERRIYTAVHVCTAPSRPDTESRAWHNVRGVRRCAAFATSETVGLGFDPEAPPSWPNTGLYIGTGSGRSATVQSRADFARNARQPGSGCVTGASHEAPAVSI